MDQATFDALETGDLIRHIKSSKLAEVTLGSAGASLVTGKSFNFLGSEHRYVLSNPDAWDLVLKKSEVPNLRWVSATDVDRVPHVHTMGDAIEHLKTLRDEMNQQTALKLDDEQHEHTTQFEKLRENMQRQQDTLNRRLGKTPPLDPKGIAGKKKPQLQLVPPIIIESMAAALAIGADKYGPWNWRENKVEIMTYLGAMKRHIDAVLEGEDLDPESGTHHLGHVAAGCAIVLDAAAQHTLVDNRPPRRPEAK